VIDDNVFASVVPRGELRELVAAIWLHRGPSATHRRDLVLPTGDTDLVINLGDLDGGATVVGPTTSPVVVDTASQRETLGVVFRVGGAAALLGLPLAEIRDLRVPLDALWGSRADGLREQALTAPTPGAGLTAIEAALTDRLSEAANRAHPATAAATAQLMAAPERWKIGELAAHLGLSSRRLQGVFHTDVGLTPKAYQRLQRFRCAAARVARATSVGWAEFAWERGYCDQSHLIRDFRAYSRLTPAEYLASRAPPGNHLALPDW
jgi:AraC-like DNA-binding protein